MSIASGDSNERDEHEKIDTENSAAEDVEFEEVEAEGGQLDLADGEERLPWLESDDDYDEGGFDIGRLVIFGAVALIALLGILGLIWVLSQPGQDEELLAEGSTIEAPDTPYRTSPDDPGGSEVAGTGDMSFEVSEGESRETRLANNAGTASPSIDREQGANGAAQNGTDANGAGSRGADARGADSGSDGAASSGSVAVQVAAYSSRARAQEGWNSVSRRFEALQGLKHRIEEASVDGATVYRLQALAGSETAADTVCRSIRAAGGDCTIIR